MTSLRALSLFASTLVTAVGVAAPAGCAVPPDATPAAPSQAQGAAQEASARKRGTIFKHDVDHLVHAIARRSAVPGEAAPYTASQLANAKILTAMGHCHRFYLAIDNPRIRSTLQQLIRARRQDGSFGDAATTAWVVDALSALAADRYADEIATARRWLGQQGATDQGWDAAVEEVLLRVRGEVYPQHIGEPASQRAVAMIEHGVEDPMAAADTLVALVACQAANRRIDQGQGEPRHGFSEAQEKAFAFLYGKQQDGLWMGRGGPDPAITGFGLLALQTKPKALRTDAEQAVIEQGLRWLLEQQNDDGSWGEEVQNYTTSVVVGALTRWDDPAAEGALQQAQKYILMCQNAENGGYQPSDRDYGSIGYGSSQRGDLSNLNFALQALRESGLPADDEAFQKAVVFLQRTQNLRSVNDFSGKVTDPDADGKLIDVTSGDDGGAAYYPGNSAAGYIVRPDGKSVPRSYGSMTYALLKSYTLCGIDKDDPRVQAAVQWISDNWTLAENPGFDPAQGEAARFAGLFYYYMVMAQALDMAGVESVTRTTADGSAEQIDWRKALRSKLESMQQADGSWVNAENQRWMEGYDVLCTCYAMTALERCQ